MTRAQIVRLARRQHGVEVHAAPNVTKYHCGKRAHALLQLGGVERDCRLAGAIEAEEDDGDAKGDGYGLVS